MISDEEWEKLKKRFPEGTLVKLKSKKCIPTQLNREISLDALYRTGQVGQDWGNVFVELEKQKMGWFVSPDMILIVEEKQRVIFD